MSHPTSTPGVWSKKEFSKKELLDKQVPFILMWQDRTPKTADCNAENRKHSTLQVKSK
jgi:hypothetical protein